MGKQKFYVVWKGSNPGVYQSWGKCQNEIKNVNGALFKSFASLEEAKKAYDQGFEEYKQSVVIHNNMGSYLGGIHLEITAENVTECLGGNVPITSKSLRKNYTTLCDPRLNREQSLELSTYIKNLSNHPRHLDRKKVNIPLF